MPVNMFLLSMHPDRVAISKIDIDPHDGLFFLDFARPLEVRRRWGFAVSLVVPVKHQSEMTSSFSIGVPRTDPAFANIRSLWKKGEYPKDGLATGPYSSPETMAAHYRLNFPDEG